MSVLPPPRSGDLIPDRVPEVAASPPAGWYADHSDPARERWWDGEGWTDVTHRRAKPSLFGEAYQRSLWAGVNRLAGVARWVNLAALLLILAGLFSVLAPGGSLATMLALVATGFALAVAGLVVAIVALRRSDRLGAKALAIHQVVAAPLAMFVGLIVLVVGLAS